MIAVPSSRRWLLASAALLLSAASPVWSADSATPDAAAAARPSSAEPAGLGFTLPPVQHYTTSDTLATEAETLVELLSNDHYNHANVHSSDYAQVIPDFMSCPQLDGARMFFLASDEADFTRRYGSRVYENVAYVGNIDPAYEIYYVFEDRARERIGWILDRLKGPFDFSTQETFAPDRTKASWPATREEADDLWTRRLKYELIAEMLNKKTLDQARQILRKRYVQILRNIYDTDGAELAEAYLDCVTELYDPHSVYWTAETYEDFAIQMKLQLVGIGAVLSSDQDGSCVIQELVPGGPADLGGKLKPKDKIVAVAQDGQEPVEIIGMKLPKIVAMIRGAKGTRVHLIVESASATDSSARRDIVITRDLVKLNSRRAHGALFQVPLQGGRTMALGVITLPAFYGPGEDSGTGSDDTSASQDVGRIIDQLKSAGAQGMVLDLRNNGGGYLSEAVNVAGLFIPPEPVVLVRDSSGDLQIPPDTEPKIAWHGPLAVLVNRFSASASEIVAGALQDYGRAVVVGDSSTHGKGTVQTVLDMKNLSRLLAYSPAKTGAVKITTQKFYLPDGASTQLRGVIPDVILPSQNDYLPIGESDLPHALIWDRQPVGSFTGKPIDPRLAERLRSASQQRQESLEEFAYLRRQVDWFKRRFQERQVSLNLAERRAEQQADEAFDKSLKVERDRLAKADDYPYKEFWVTPPPPALLSTVRKPSGPGSGETQSGDSDDDDDDDFGLSDKPGYPPMDVPLRETLRVLRDAINLGHNRQYWASNHPPLTVADQG